MSLIEAENRALEKYIQAEPMSMEEVCELLKEAQKKIEKIRQSKNSSRMKIRKQLAVLVRIAQTLLDPDRLNRALAKVADKQEAPQKSSSEYLYLVRYVGLGDKAGSARRHADVIAACLNSPHSPKKTRKQLIKHGPTFMLKEYGVRTKS